ncbi:hypothetical protein HPB50_018737 [Hyalomma asiaticum]|uniref:Uncharacterized protein n=1 Tax=Hyalomma asiaticum TaxID=266040 RepID=A0ACB7RU66_HYAAI|nr:hypothetical protein HPB50_018737 [Hyalomma asiaticum]
MDAADKPGAADDESSDGIIRLQDEDDKVPVPNSVSSDTRAGLQPTACPDPPPVASVASTSSALLPQTPQGPQAKRHRQGRSRLQMEGYMSYLKAAEEAREKWRKDCVDLEERRLAAEERHHQELMMARVVVMGIWSVLAALICLRAKRCHAFVMLESEIDREVEISKEIEEQLLGNSFIAAAVLAESVPSMRRPVWSFPRNERWFEDTLPHLTEFHFKQALHVSPRVRKVVESADFKSTQAMTESTRIAPIILCDQAFPLTENLTKAFTNPQDGTHRTASSSPLESLWVANQ